jgi:hypothetical protein
MFIKKATFSQKFIQIWFLSKNDQNTFDEMYIGSPDLPAQTFSRALKNARKHFVDFAELPDSFESQIEITGIQFEHFDDDFGAKMKAIRELKNSETTMTLVSPVKWTEGALSGVRECMSESAKVDINFLKIELEKFVSGKRAQLGLFDTERHERIVDENSRILDAELLPKAGPI